MKIQEVTSNIVIAEKNEKQYIKLTTASLRIRGTQGAFSYTRQGCFSYKPEFQCPAQFVKNPFVDDSK